MGKQIFINHTRAEFSGQDKYDAGQIIIELYFLHELGHIVLDKKLKDSFFINVFRRGEFKEDALAQVIKNIEEGFCDVFASYLTQQKNNDLDIIKRYQNVRDESPKSKDKEQYFIEPYDVVNCFDKLKNKYLPNEHLMDDLLHIAVENTKELVLARLNECVDFKKELEIELIKNNEKEIHLNSNQDYLKEIDLLLFDKGMDLDNKVSHKSSIIKNITEIRQKYGIQNGKNNSLTI